MQLTAGGSLVETTSGCALVQQFSVVKLKVLVERVMFLTGLKPFPGRSPCRDICAVMVSLAWGGSVRLHRHHQCLESAGPVLGRIWALRYMYYNSREH